jgi:hypothetical protein
MEVVVGPRSTDCIVLTFLGRTHAGASDFWDGNWLRARLTATVRGFVGDVTADLRVDELADFRAQLERLYEVVEADAAFETMERWLDLQFHGDGLGHIEVTGEMYNQAGQMGDSLRFRLEIDRTYLPSIIDALQAVETEWPILGRP